MRAVKLGGIRSVTARARSCWGSGARDLQQRSVARGGGEAARMGKDAERGGGERGKAAEVMASAEAWEGGEAVGREGEGGRGEKRGSSERGVERASERAQGSSVVLCLFGARGALGGMKSRCGRWDGPRGDCPSHQQPDINRYINK